MATLNIMCVICNEFYKAADTVFSTTECGHLFHKQCLFRWLNTSQTCPQCRHPCHIRRAHRVFLNFSEPTELDYELDMINLDNPDWQILDLPPGHGPHIPPANALQSGTDQEGNEIYVARCPYDVDMLPANYIPMKGHALVPWNCKAHTVNFEHIEYLVDDGRYAWVAASNGTVPENAVTVGYAASCRGESLYTGRAVYHGITTPGKVHPSHKVLYMPWNEKEENIKEYEVLVRLPKPADDTCNTSAAATETIQTPDVPTNVQQLIPATAPIPPMQPNVQEEEVGEVEEEGH